MPIYCAIISERLVLRRIKASSITRILKHTMMDDALRIIFPDGEIPDLKSRVTDVPPNDLGCYEILYDEAMAGTALVEKEKRITGSKKSAATWK